MKITAIVGARPHFIKLTPILEELVGHKIKIVHTGQHYDYEMSKIFFKELHIPKPDYHLGVKSESHAEQTGKMLIGVEWVLLKEKPALVLVFGDTNSTLAGGLAAVKLHIPVAHIEAGLRSFDRRMPEEINRVIVDQISDHLLCPTKTSIKNLKEEGIVRNCHLVGDVMIDAIMKNIKIAKRKSKILERLSLKKKDYLLATIHRAENTDDKKNLSEIVNALSKIEETLLFPCHPRTLKFLKKYDLYTILEKSKFVNIIKPVSYLDFLVLEKNARLILTDSGGVQKEAYFLGVPCVTVRDSTEWVETVRDGWNTLVEADREKIVSEVKSFRPKGKRKESYGCGRASANIIKVIDSLVEI